MAITKTSQAFTDTASNGQTTFTAGSAAIGNCVVVCTFVADTAVHVTGITGTGFTWSQAGSGYVSGSTVPGGASYLQIWLGVASAVESTAQTQTATFSASNSALYTGFFQVGEFANGAGSSATWAVDGTQTGGQTNASAASVLYPTLSAAAAGELYVGNGNVGSGGTAGTTGSPTGFTFVNSVQGGQPACYSILSASGSTGTVSQANPNTAVTASYSVLLVAGGGTTSVSATAADTAAASDAVARTAAHPRTVADTAAASDAVARTLTSARTASDTAAASDSVTGFSGKLVQDTAAATDTVARSAQALTRAATDSAGASDTTARTTAHPRSIADTAAAADTAVRTAANVRSVTDTAAATDTVARTNALTRAVTDTAGALDHAGTGLPVTDTAGAADTATRTTALTRTAADSAGASDSTARTARLLRPISDTAAASDALTVPAVTHTINASKNWPLMGFEVDFQNGPPSLPTGTRKSVNAVYRRLFVRKWDTARGRQYELDQVQAGTCNLMLPDPNELLDPDNPASPFNTAPNQVTPYRAMWIWGMWPTQPGSGNIINPGVDAGYDSSFEAGTGLWAAAGGSTTLAQSTAQAYTGTHSLLITQSAAGAGSGATIGFRTAPGISYTFSAWVYPTGGCAVQAQVTDANGVVHTSNVIVSSGVWQRISVSWQTVDTLEPVVVYGTGTSTPTFYVDATMLEFGATVNPYTATGPTLYPIFTGYVERYPTTYDNVGLRALRPLQAVDGLAILSRAAINQSYDAEVTADSPAMYWRMDNPVSPATALQLDTGATGTKLGSGMGPGAVPYYTISPSGSINWAGDSHLDGTAAVAITGQNSTNPPTLFSANSFTEMPVQGGNITLNGDTGFTWECWVRWVSGTVQFGTLEVVKPGDPLGLNQGVPMIAGGDFGLGSIGLAYNANGTSYQGYFPSASVRIYPDGVWHLLYLTVAAGTFRVGVDAIGLSGAISTTQVGPVAYNTFYQEASAQYTIAQAQSSTGRFAVYPSVLSNTRLLAHYQRGVGYYGEASGARITRLLSKYWAGTTKVAAGTALLAPDFTYSPISTGGKTSQPRTVLDVSQEIQETERGLFYVSAAGAVTFEDRTSRYLTQTSSAVFGEDPPAGAPINSNPYFTTDATGWTASGGTFARTTAVYHDAPAAGLLTPDGVSGAPLIRSVPVAAMPGISYTGTVWLYSNAAVGSVSVYVDWLDSSGAQVGTSPTQNVALSAGVWTQLSCAGTAPVTMATARLAVVMFGTPPSATLLYVDDAKLYPTSQTTEYPYTNIKYDHDPVYTFSQADLSRPGNSSFPVRVNTATQAKFGQRILTQTAQVNQDFDLTQAGIFYLQRYGTPVTRVNTLVLTPSANPALWPVILGLELSQRVTVTRRSAFTRSSDYYIEKIAHSVDAETGSWTTTLQLSPVFVPVAWVLGDATYGVLGSTTIPIY